MSSILIVGGGSGGHIAPMVAVAEGLKAIEPDCVISFVCSDRPSDGAFLAMEGQTFETLPLPRRSFALPALLWKGFQKSCSILKQQHPDVVFSKGGAVSVPLCLAAWTLHIPVIVHESDAVMGGANRIVSRFATKTLRGTEIGNPIRARILTGNKEEGLRITGCSGTKPILLVMGGSQGAQAINEAITTHLDELLKTVDIIHLTGPGKHTAVNRAGYYATEFGSDVLPHFYACTDIAISRAGASSIAELQAWNIPSILVPIRGLAGNHQVKNAEHAVHTYPALFTELPQEDLDANLVAVVRETVASKTQRDHKRYTHPPEAARLIAETIVQSVAR